MTPHMPEPIEHALRPLFNTLPINQAMEHLLVNGQAPSPHTALVEQVLNDPALQGRTTLQAGLWLYVDDLDRSHAISQNLRSTFLCSQAFARAMVQRGVRGAIVNVASMSGLRASVRLGPYGAAKAGVMHYTQTVAAELAPHGIRVNCVAPASINTPRAQASQSQERLQEMANAIPLKRLCEPEDVAKAILFLASDLASFITGQTLMCDGGLSITSARPPMREDAAEARG